MAPNKYLDSVECSDQPLDFAFHPSRENIVAAALVDGSLEVHDIRHVDHGDDDEDEDGPESILSSLSLHNQLLPEKGSDKKKPASCRAVRFSTDGTRIYTGGSAGDLYCIDAERVCTFTTNAENSIHWSIETATEGTYTPLTVIHPFHTATTLLATGDDLGGVRVWDERIRSGSAPVPKSSSKKSLPQGCVLSWKENEDYISDMELAEDGNTLLATSADGRLAVFDLRMSRDPSLQSKSGQKPFRLSDDQEDELLSMKIIKNGKKVVCGTQNGVLSVFSWGVWGDCSDRFPGHPLSIETLLKVDEDTLLTGSSDGLIRVVQIHPDKLLGVMGKDHGGFPVEQLGFNASREIVGSISHDCHIHLWDASILHDGSDDENDESDDDKDNDQTAKPKATTVVTGNDSDDDWDDMDAKAQSDDDDSKDDDDDDDDDDSDDDDDDSDDEEVATLNDKRKKRLKSESEKFFDDL